MARATAFHEAGHAVADCRLGFGCTIVSIEPDDEHGRAGHSGSLYGWEGTPEDIIVALLAGYAASLACGEDPAAARAGADDDFERVAELISAHGGTEEQHVARAENFVHQNWEAIERVAEELEERRKLLGEEVEVLIEVVDGKATEAELARFRLLMEGTR